MLLDEPTLTLHAKAQADFPRFINDRLAPVAQVLYTFQRLIKRINATLIA